MATTGELREIIEELQLIDAGDAANYLGEKASDTEALLVPNVLQESLGGSPTNDPTPSCKD